MTLISVFAEQPQGFGLVVPMMLPVGAGSAATATERASTWSFSRPCPVASWRTRQLSSDDTSTTATSSSINRWVNGRPRPLLLLLAQRCPANVGPDDTVHSSRRGLPPP
ncbi:hypothetical protein ABZU76_33660 [Amycolatopsis sp. NPDC005232]|uniref:hypothetical protein n=1 Tax=Amycolatopsis sp. NPDC005232 TaxID=3157027 RepID=UPI0033B2B798